MKLILKILKEYCEEVYDNLTIIGAVYYGRKQK